MCFFILPGTKMIFYYYFYFKLKSNREKKHKQNYDANTYILKKKQHCIKKSF